MKSRHNASFLLLSSMLFLWAAQPNCLASEASLSADENGTLTKQTATQKPAAFLNNTFQNYTFSTPGMVPNPRSAPVLKSTNTQSSFNFPVNNIQAGYSNRTGPTYPGAQGIPARNVNDILPPGVQSTDSSSSNAAKMLKQNFPLPVKSTDAETFTPAGYLDKAFGLPSAPRKDYHLYK